MEKSGRQSGEFVVNGNVVRSARRLRQYLKAREKGAHKEIFHVIQPMYCEMLGIDPEEMIAIAIADVWAEKFRKQILETFHQLPTAIPLSERVLRAHSEAYSGGMDELLEFIKTNFIDRAGPQNASSSAK